MKEIYIQKVQSHVVVAVLADIVQVLLKVSAAFAQSAICNLHCAFHRHEYTGAWLV